VGQKSLTVGGMLGAINTSGESLRLRIPTMNGKNALTVRRFPLFIAAFFVGAIVHGGVSAFVSEGRWKFFHQMPLYWAVDVLSPIFGDGFVYSHKVFTCILGAVFHGLLFGLVGLLVVVGFQNILPGRRRLLFYALAGLTLVDLVLLVLILPMPPE
jgi:hypothetical protein